MNKAVANTLMVALTWSATMSSAMGGIAYQPDRVSSIAAVSNAEPGEELAFRSGLFVAYAGDFGGRIVFYEDVSQSNTPEELVETVSFGFYEPTAIAERDGNLIVWENAERALYRLDLRSGRRQILTETGLDIVPSQIAVSPEGLVVLLDERAGLIYWTTIDGGELRFVPFKTRSTSVAFLSWDKLAVLDREEQSITVLTLSIEGADLDVAYDSDLSLNEIRRSNAGEFRAITSRDGALYVADSTRIFSYIAATGELITAVDYGADLQDIRQLQVSADSFYVIDGEEFRKIKRTVPVEVVFEGFPYVSQLALLELYDYLGGRNVLSSRETVAGKNYETLERFLFDERVFIALSSSFPTTRERSGFPGRRSRRTEPISEFEAQYSKFENVFCKMNAEICVPGKLGSIFLRPVSGGTVLQVPNLNLKSRLGVQRYTLQGVMASEYLDALILSPELRQRADERLLRRLNKERCGEKTRSCLQQSSGEMMLPYETWTVDTAVLSPDLDSRESALEAITAYEGVQVYSHQVNTKQQAYSHHLSMPPGVPVTDSCKDLSEKHEAWHEMLSYPSDYGRFIASIPRIGVAEEEVLKKHQVFELHKDSPTWYAYSETEIDLVPDPSPASLAGGVQAVDGSNVFTPTKHHGTHVSAMIGGRAGHCWSGLLPEARLVHIDASSAPTFRGGVFDAHSGFVRVVNVSQRLSNNNEYKSILVDDSSYREILFVLAAGNEGDNLNTKDVPTAATWGDKENIVVVTALDDKQQVIGPYLVGTTEQPGSTFGKRFVDLAAPGFELYSATADKKYGPATGTSQAAPAVAAAAAYLIDEDVGWAKSPGQVKARLIATANWHDGLDGEVWGGMLNLGDAVRFPDRNIVRTTTGGTTTIYDIGLNARAKFNIDNWPAAIYDRERDDLKYREKKIKLRLILSLKYNDDASEDGTFKGTFRMVYRDPKNAENRLQIIPKAQLSGTVRCESARKWIVGTSTWIDDPLCDEAIDVTQLMHFFRALNYDVDW